MQKIAIQSMLFRNEIIEQGIFEVFSKFPTIGSKYVELSMVALTKENIAGLKKAREEFGIELIALSGAMQSKEKSKFNPSLIDEYDIIVETAKEFGVEHIRLGSFPGNIGGTRAQIEDDCKRTNEYVEKLKEHGLKLHLHNHHREFMKLDGKYVIDIVKDLCPDAGFEIDVFWVQRGGETPQEYIKNFANRLDLLHLKDYKIAHPRLDKVDEEFKAKNPDLFNDVVRFAEIGEGNLHIKEIIEVSKTLGTKYLIIEQDQTYGADKYDCYKKSIDNLAKMGYTN
ncbi:sugar phosphate isomerase/epimerase family protein [Candidatus Epulonipiscium viviparus]|uniref:sugar phosphate isomerase/epimerase family protein n=1 Tax=Candidatus Epulonipiscium viviparus TaxID=420336 RepID=UPI000496018D|nr:sugar phosphate isomerase/epimerase [Candidatus Epulopiscium viviparus]